MSRSSSRRRSRTSIPKRRSAKKPKSLSRSKTARKLISLTKRAKLYQADAEQYIEFLRRVGLWFEGNLEEIWNIICGINLDEEETITYDSFKAILIDVKAPFNVVEMQLVTMILDPNTEGSIQLKKFSGGVLELCKEEEKKALHLCPSPLIKPIVRWVRVHFRNSTLASVPHHPLHFDEDVPSFYTTSLLIDIVRRKHNICAPSVKLFKKHASLPPEEMEQVNVSLEHLGINGGTRLSPTEVTILYQTQCNMNLPGASLFVNSIIDCFLLWDEAALWLEDVDSKKPGVPSEESRPASEDMRLMGLASSSDSDSSSVDSLASFFTVEKRTKRRAKRMRNLVRRCEQRMRDPEGAHSSPPSTTSPSVSRHTNQ